MADVVSSMVSTLTYKSYDSLVGTVLTVATAMALLTLTVASVATMVALLTLMVAPTATAVAFLTIPLQEIPYWVPPPVYKASEVGRSSPSSTLIQSLTLYPCAPFLSPPSSTQTT